MPEAGSTSSTGLGASNYFRDGARCNNRWIDPSAL